MTISASTNVVDLGVETNRRPVVHLSSPRSSHSLTTALPTREDDMAEPKPVDAVLTIPRDPKRDRHEQGVEDSSSLRRVREDEALLLTSSEAPAPSPLRFLPVPPMRKAPYTFRLLQQWEGTVTEIADGDFTAELRDLTEPASHREEATFELEEVSPGDQSLLAPGAVFRWSIGYRTSASGQRERVSQLRFVRIPGWRKSAVEEIKRRAARLQERFPLT